jgi:hypothetical protein
VQVRIGDWAAPRYKSAWVLASRASSVNDDRYKYSRSPLPGARPRSRLDFGLAGTLAFVSGSRAGIFAGTDVREYWKASCNQGLANIIDIRMGMIRSLAS